MTELLQRAEQAGWGVVVLLGDSDYYGRFGFETAAALGIVYPPVGPESPYFQARRTGRDDPSPEGSFRYIWEDPETSP
jgi:putative acetyltransferase